MKTRTLLLLTLLLAVWAASPVLGADKADFWGNLQGKLQKVTPAKKTNVTTAVGGVRAAKNESASDVYWKGKEKSHPVTEEELQKFNLAVDTKLKGNNEQAIKLFEEFLTNYPQSALRVDGLQAMDKIKEEMAAAKAPAKVVTKKSSLKKNSAKTPAETSPAK